MADKFAEFNMFQSLFYTDVEGFNRYTDYDIKNNAFMLILNIGKGFPHLADKFLNLYSPEVKAIQSPAIIKALQRKFCNGFSRTRIPQFIYYQSAKKKAEPKEPKQAKSKSRKKADDIVNLEPSVPIKKFDFDDPTNKEMLEVKREICSMLMYDSKTFEYYKNSDKVQNLAAEIVG